MRIIIYGAGAIGSAVGGYLALNNQDTILIGRSGHMETINNQGLRIVTGERIRTVKLKTATSIEEVKFKPDDIVFMTMKGQDAEKSFQGLRKAAGDVPVFCFQNGVRNEETASKYFSRVYGVTVYINVLYEKNGEVTSRRDPPGGFIIGRYPEGVDDITEKVAEKLRAAGFLTVASPVVMSHKWGKLFLNLGNAVSGITNAKGNQADFIVNAARRELQGLVSEAGIKVTTREDLLKQEPAFMNQITPKTNQSGHHSQGSTWQSLMRQSGSVETEYLNGEAVRLAAKLGKKAPINEKITKICMDMAVNRIKPGEYTPAELGALLGFKNPA